MFEADFLAPLGAKYLQKNPSLWEGLGEGAVAYVDNIDFFLRLRRHWRHSLRKMRTVHSGTSPSPDPSQREGR